MSQKFVIIFTRVKIKIKNVLDSMGTSCSEGSVHAAKLHLEEND